MPDPNDPKPIAIGGRVRVIEGRGAESGRTGTVRLMLEFSASVEMDDTGEHRPWAIAELEAIDDE